MEKFIRHISLLVLLISAGLALLLHYQGYQPSAIFFFVVALAVSAIPEGLPVALTVALSIATKRMSKRNVIVRKLTAVESLGSCTVIASDKPAPSPSTSRRHDRSCCRTDKVSSSRAKGTTAKAKWLARGRQRDCPNHMATGEKGVRAVYPGQRGIPCPRGR